MPGRPSLPSPWCPGFGIEWTESINRESLGLWEKRGVDIGPKSKSTSHIQKWGEGATATNGKTDSRDAGQKAPKLSNLFSCWTDILCMDLCKVRLTYLDPRSLFCRLLKVFLPRLNSNFQMSGGVKLKLALEVSLSNRHTHKLSILCQH